MILLFPCSSIQFHSDRRHDHEAKNWQKCKKRLAIGSHNFIHAHTHNDGKNGINGLLICFVRRSLEEANKFTRIALRTRCRQRRAARRRENALSTGILDLGVSVSVLKSSVWATNNSNRMCVNTPAIKRRETVSLHTRSNTRRTFQIWDKIAKSMRSYRLEACPPHPVSPSIGHRQMLLFSMRIVLGFDLFALCAGMSRH